MALLRACRYLQLSDNLLSGGIPESFSNLRDLQ
jgi:hypothetical protein